MTEQADFLRAIIAQPDDDSLRLVYADWLQDHGDEARAEFIRLSCEVVKWPYFKDDIVTPFGPVGDLRQRASSLLQENGRLWTTPAVALVCGWAPRSWPSERTWAFRRGFIAAITCHAERWIRYADQIVAEQPIETVRFVPRLENPGLGYLCRIYENRSRRSANGKSFDEICSGIWPRIKFRFVPLA